MRTSVRILVLTSVTSVLAGAAVAAAAGPASADPSKPAVVRNGNNWLLRTAVGGGTANISFSYGSPGDFIHVTGDWDGNGSKTPGIVRIIDDGAAGSHYDWFLRTSNSAGAATISFSYGRASFGFEEPGDVPVVGDWDGNGTDTPGALRAPNDSLQWLLRNSNTSGGAQVQFNYGKFFDRAVVGDWDDNGVDGPGLIRDEAGRWTWLLKNNFVSGNAQTVFAYGSTGTDDPVVWK